LSAIFLLSLGAAFAKKPVAVEETVVEKEVKPKKTKNVKENGDDALTQNMCFFNGMQYNDGDTWWPEKCSICTCTNGEASCQFIADCENRTSI